MSPTEILNAVLGVGGIAFITAVYKAYKDWREGAWQRQDTAIADLEQWRSDADDAREWEAAQHSYWRDWAGRLEYRILTGLGHEHLPERPPYPIKPIPAIRPNPRESRRARHRRVKGEH